MNVPSRLEDFSATVNVDPFLLRIEACGPQDQQALKGTWRDGDTGFLSPNSGFGKCILNRSQRR